MGSVLCGSSQDALPTCLPAVALHCILSSALPASPARLHPAAPGAQEACSGLGLALDLREFKRYLSPAQEERLLEVERSACDPGSVRTELRQLGDQVERDGEGQVEAPRAADAGPQTAAALPAPAVGVLRRSTRVQQAQSRQQVR